MIRSPITLCLFTSTKGHFGRTDLYRQTVEGLLSQAPAESWGALVAHVKVDPDTEGRARGAVMAEWLHSRGFRVTTTEGEWSHFADSHQTGYRDDVRRVLDTVITPYVLHLEDDWHVACYRGDLEGWLHEGTRLLEENPALVQVRIARFTDEAKRIAGLHARHGIDGRVGPYDPSVDKSFRHSDLSMNPSLFRTRDLRAALAFLVAAQGLPQHIEHGTAITLKLISGHPLPFACLNPLMVRVGHLGTRTPEEGDDLTKPLLSS